MNVDKRAYWMPETAEQAATREAVQHVEDLTMQDAADAITALMTAINEPPCEHGATVTAPPWLYRPNGVSSSGLVTSCVTCSAITDLTPTEGAQP
mgnify:CR=1 FL=1